MTTRYLDASALLRILFGEPGPSAPIGRGTSAVTSRLAEVETFRAVDRARIRGHLDEAQATRRNRDLQELLDNVHLVPISDEVIALARAPFPLNVRALDALHVATAQVLSAEVGALEFWTHDARQAAAAATRGLIIRGVVVP